MSDQQTVTPSTAPVLESMTLGMILDKAINLYSRNFLLLVAITAIPQVVFSAGYVLLTNTTFADRAPGLLLLGLALLILSLVGNGIGGGAMTVVVGSRYLGRDVAFKSAYKAAFRRAGPIVGGTLLAYLFIFLGFLGLTVPGLILAVSYSLISPVIMLEGVGGAKSLKRSRLLIKGYRWQTFLLYLMYWVVLEVVGFVAGLLAGLAFEGAPVPPLTALINALVTIFLGPFSSVLSVLLYYNQRIRKEGFDLAFLAEAMAPHVA
jgi:hypothetical protein